MVSKSFILAPLLFAVACAGDVGPQGPGSDDPSDPNNPDGPDAVAQISGEYEVTSAFDLRNSPDMPAIVAGALGPLSGLADDPAGTLLDALEGTSVGEVFDSLPSAVRSLVEDQINDYIQNQVYDGVPVVGQIADITDMVSSILTNFEVVTSLQVGNGDAAGNANAQHGLLAIAYPQDGNRVVVATPEIINALSIARDVSVNVNLDASTINFGDHTLELPLGDFAVTAFHSALEAQFGIGDLSVALSDMVNCTSLASSIGDISVAGFTVVDEAQLDDFCEQGLDLAAEQVDEQIRKLEFARLHFMGGDGIVDMESKVDDVGSSQVGTMSGDWQSELAINNAGFAAPSSFKAVRKN